MCEAPKFARHLKWACPNRTWAWPSKARGPQKREASGICRIYHVVNPALRSVYLTVFLLMYVFLAGCHSGCLYIHLLSVCHLSIILSVCHSVCCLSVVCLFVCHSVHCLSVILSVYLLSVILSVVCLLSVYHSVCLSFCLSVVCHSVCPLSVCLSVILFVILSVYLLPVCLLSVFVVCHSVCCLPSVCSTFFYSFSPSSRLSYYAIFDGHAGGEASKFAADNLHKNIVTKFPKGCRQNKITNKNKILKIQMLTNTFFSMP